MRYAVAILLALTIPASAADTNSANYFLPGCKSWFDREKNLLAPDEAMMQGLCAGFVAGVVYAAAPNSCIPQGVTNNQVMAVVIKYIEARPDTTSEQINIGVIVDFQKKAVLGLSGDSEPVLITSISETTISFAAQETGWVMNGTLDRMTGALFLSSVKFVPSTRKTILTVSLDLQCKPTQRMF